VRADIYSLGGTLYFMLTGQTPFPEGTIAAKLVAHQTREPRSVESQRADVPAGVLAVLRKMMAKESVDRYQEPIEVAEALAAWADQEVGLPPTKEMPGLCPLVLSLTGHSVDKSGSQVPLARALFGPGRSVFRGGSGSSIRALGPGGSKAGMETARPAGTKTTPGRPAGATPPGKRHAAGGGPVSTARTTAAATAPIPVKPEPPLAIEDDPPAEEIGTGLTMALPPRRTRTFILLAAAFALLLLAAVISAVAAYYLGKSNKTEADSASGRRVAWAHPVDEPSP